MVRLVVLGSCLLFPVVAGACDGARKDGSTQQASAHEQGDPAACAKKAALVDGACSYSTGMMAQRVMAEGSPWTFAGTMVSADSALASRVAAPYLVGPEGVRVIANQVLESISDAGLASARVNLEGRLLEVDGVQYFVLTAYQQLNS